MKLQLGAIERAFSRRHFERQARRAGRCRQRRFRAIPYRIAAGAQRGARGELNLETREAQVRIYDAQQVAETGYFHFDLIFGAKDVRVVLREGARALQAFERS